MRPLLLLVLGACASTPDVKDALAPCARARLAREFPADAPAQGCYVVDVGPDALRGAGTLVLTTLKEDHLEDEPPRYRLATTAAVFPATTPPTRLTSSKTMQTVTTSWEQLSARHARLFWLSGTHGIEVCLEGEDNLTGTVVVVDDAPPFAHAAGAVQLRRVTCPA